MRSVSTQIRLVVCALLMLGVLIGTTGLIPNSLWASRVLGSLSGERYPCESGACGCGSAKQCWTTCRCQPMSQKVIWAQRNGVQIPEYVVLSLVSWSDSGAQPACSLCSSGESNQAQVNQHPAEDGLPTLTPFGCRGIEFLLAFAPVIGTPNQIEWNIQSVCVIQLIAALDDQTPSSRDLDPATPPPREMA